MWQVTSFLVAALVALTSAGKFGECRFLYFFLKFDNLERESFQKNLGLLTFLIDQLSSQKKIETGSLEFNVFLCYTGDSLKQCDANDQNALNTCLFQIVEDLRPFMPTGDQFYN